VAWCAKERKITNADIEKKKSAIGELDTEIASLTTEIEDPVTGLLIQIKTEEGTLSKCIKDQAEETKDRQDENAEYQKEIANCVKSQDLMTRAMRVLKKYYGETMKKSGFVQIGSDNKDAPDTWKDEYKGQSENGNKVTATLQTILENIQKGEENAHSAEVTAQHAFEDSMTKLKKDEKDAQESITELRVSLAEKQKTLHRKTKDQKATTKEKKALQEYLLDMKPECDYIVQNIAAREFNRKQEGEALDKAVKQIKDTNAYKEGELDEKIAKR